MDGVGGGLHAVTLPSSFTARFSEELDVLVDECCDVVVVLLDEEEEDAADDIDVFTLAHIGLDVLEVGGNKAEARPSPV